MIWLQIKNVNHRGLKEVIERLDEAKVYNLETVERIGRITTKILTQMIDFVAREKESAKKNVETEKGNFKKNDSGGYVFANSDYEKMYTDNIIKLLEVKFEVHQFERVDLETIGISAGEYRMLDMVGLIRWRKSASNPSNY